MLIKIKNYILYFLAMCFGEKMSVQNPDKETAYNVYYWRGMVHMKIGFHPLYKKWADKDYIKAGYYVGYTEPVKTNAPPKD